MSAHGVMGTGYAFPMLAVVVLLPIMIMLAAVLLERFEAHATRVIPPRTSRADLRLPPSRPAPATPTPHLALVPHDEDGPADTPATGSLRRAS